VRKISKATNFIGRRNTPITQ